MVAVVAAERSLGIEQRAGFYFARFIVFERAIVLLVRRDFYYSKTFFDKF